MNFYVSAKIDLMMKYLAVYYLSNNSITFGINNGICLLACDRSNKEFGTARQPSEDFSHGWKRILPKNWISSRQQWSMKCGKKSTVRPAQTVAKL